MQCCNLKRNIASCACEAQHNIHSPGLCDLVESQSHPSRGTHAFGKRHDDQSCALCSCRGSQVASTRHKSTSHPGKATPAYPKARSLLEGNPHNRLDSS